MLEITTMILVLLLAVILTVYNHRQAAALRGMESLVQDFVAMQIRDRRSKQSRELESLNPLDWFSEQVSAKLISPLPIIEVLRVIPDVQAVDLRAPDNRRLVVSTFPKSDLLRFDSRLRASHGKSASERVASFASHLLLGKSRWGWGVKVVERVMDQSAEFFDLEATAVGKRIGVNWGHPSRLWFYVVD